MQLINLKQLKTSLVFSGRERSAEMRRRGRNGYVLVNPLYCYNIKPEVLATLRETLTIKNILLTAL